MRKRITEKEAIERLRELGFSYRSIASGAGLAPSTVIRAANGSVMRQKSRAAILRVLVRKLRETREQQEMEETLSNA